MIAGKLNGRVVSVVPEALVRASHAFTGGPCIDHDCSDAKLLRQLLLSLPSIGHPSVG